MRLIGVTQNIIHNKHGESLDALDQNWIKFLLKCQLTPLPLPNNLNLVKRFINEFSFEGFLLTGGNDLVAYGGKTQQRDDVETLLIKYAISKNIPLFGVCRGMQIIQHYFGVKLKKVRGHIAKEQSIEINGKMNTVNSFHCFGSFDTTGDLTVWARSKDNLIKAVSHKKYLIQAIMWHPERISPNRKEDVNLFKSFFLQIPKNRELKAIILAAGRGSRMQRLTDKKPKCLVNLKGKPLVEWQLDALRKSGIKDIAVVSGYKAKKLQPFSLKTFNNSRWKKTNMVSSLVCADEWLNRHTCIVSYSDIVYSKQAIEVLLKSTSDITIAYDKKWLNLWKMRFANPLDDAETFKITKGGVLLEIGNKTDKLENIEGQYMGLLKITPPGWKKIKKYLSSLDLGAGDKLDMTSLLQRLINEGIKIFAIPISGNWYEVDTKSDLNLYNRLDNLHLD